LTFYNRADQRYYVRVEATISTQKGTWVLFFKSKSMLIDDGTSIFFLVNTTRRPTQLADESLITHSLNTHSHTSAILGALMVRCLIL